MKRKALLLINLVLALLMVFSSISFAFTSVPVKSISLNKTSLSLAVGQTATLTALISPKNATNKVIIWSSSDNRIAKVNAKGVVTAIKVGKATITAKSKYDKATAKCIVTILQTDAKSKEGSLDKKLTIIWGGCYKDIEDDNYVEKEIQKKYNVEIKPLKIYYGDKEQVNMMLASGDKWNIMLYDGDPIKLYNSGVLKTIPKDLIKKYAPNYAKIRDENPVGWQYRLIPGKDNEYYALTGYASNIQCNASLPFVRLDWLENLNMVPDGISYITGSNKVALLDKPLPYSEYEKMLYAFIQKDPDKNGKDDTCALGGGKNPNNPVVAFEQILGTFGLNTSFNLMEDGKLIHSFISNKFKQFLKLMHKYYNDGLIDKEFATDNVQKYWGKIVEGKIGSGMTDYDWADVSLYKDRPPATLFARNPNAKFMLMRFPVNDNGVGGGTPGLTPFVGNYCISKDTTDEELIRILQIFDGINYNKDLVVATRYGKEGETFNMVDGSATLKEGVDAKKYGFYYYNLYTYEKWYLKYLYKPIALEILDKLASKNDGARPARLDVAGKTNEVNSKYMPQIDTLMNQFIVKAIIGEVNVDSDWDKYVKSIYDAGWDKIAEAMMKYGVDFSLIK